MIKAEHLCKSFGSISAANDISLTIEPGQVFGLIGTNGAGKSTLLRLLAGILRPDAGCARIDEADVFDNPAAKKKLFFISDDMYFFPNSTPEDMKNYYTEVYAGFDAARFRSLADIFGIGLKRKIRTFSKGMKKQLAVICGISAGTEYLFCDETFDGLDPVMRQAVKSIFADDMSSRGLTPVIASHNLRELEDICDHVGLLHRGGMLLSEDLWSLKLGIQKVQFVLSEGEDEENVLKCLNVISKDTRGRLTTAIIRGGHEETERHFRGISTVFFELLPLTLEEIFISETEVAGYDVRKLILG